MNDPRDHQIATQIGRMIAEQLACHQRWPALLRREEAAKYLAISSRKIGDLLAAGEIPHVKIDGSVRFPKTGLDRLIDEKTQLSNTKRPPGPN